MRWYLWSSSCRAQIIVSTSLKTSPLVQRKKRVFCKYHNFLGHKTSQYVIFSYLLQNALKDGRMKFDNKLKPTMKIDSNLLKVKEVHFIEPVEVMMVDIGEGLNNNVEEVSMIDCTGKIKVVYPKAEEELMTSCTSARLKALR